ESFELILRCQPEHRRLAGFGIDRKRRRRIDLDDPDIIFVDEIERSKLAVTRGAEFLLVVAEIKIARMGNDALDRDASAGRDKEELVFVPLDRLSYVRIGREPVRREGPSRRLGQRLAILILGDEIDRSFQLRDYILGEILFGARVRRSAGFVEMFAQR